MKDDFGSARTTTTEVNGRFAAAGLRPGTYAVNVSAPGFEAAVLSGIHLIAGESEDITVALRIASVAEEITVSSVLPAAEKAAPSHPSLIARSAQSEISGHFVQNFTAPTAEFTQVVQMAPGTFTFNPNGVGLGDSKVFYRGFQDGYYNVTFDGIPIADTNNPSHHSWMFPAQIIGVTRFDRSPGSAAAVGPATYGGSINLMSRGLDTDPVILASASYGAFSTRLLDAQFSSGDFDPRGRSRLFVDVHNTTSDGYQTYNRQTRDAFSAKYQYAVDDRTAVTVFASYVNIGSNAPQNKQGPTRAQLAQYGQNYLLSGRPSDANYYGYYFNHTPTDLEYVGIRSTIGGWAFDDKVYAYQYDNKQGYNGATISATSGTDKLNTYRKVGNLLPLSHTSPLGVFRTGLWSEYAWSDRSQTPSDPRTWVDAALPNFHEKFNTTTQQPYAEFEWTVTPALRLTPGLKLAYYKQDFTQFADLGKTVGDLAGAPSISHAAEYHTWLPSFDAHYLLERNWSVYAQYGKGQTIPPTSVFDVKNARVAVLPKPTVAHTYQAGTVWKIDRLTLGVDAYRIRFENDYTSAPDPVTLEPVYYLSGSAITNGIEAEGNLLWGRGFGVYLNATAGRARYADTGLWVQNAPRDTEAVGLIYSEGRWNVGLFNKRIGRMYNDNGSTNQAVPIAPFSVTNLFVNFTVGTASRFRQSKIRLTVNNLFDGRNIVGVTPASTKTSVPAPGDMLNLMAPRNVSLTLTVGFSPKKP